MDTLLAKLSEQQAILEKQKQALGSAEENATQHDRAESITSSVPLTPATDVFDVTPDTEANDEEETIKLDAAEMLRLKRELDAARDKIARQEQELSQTRVIKHTLDQVMGPPSGPDATIRGNSTERNIGNLGFNASSRPVMARQDNFVVPDDARSDISDALSAGAYNRGQNIWSSPARHGFQYGLSGLTEQSYQQPAPNWGQSAARPWGTRNMTQGLPALVTQQQQLQQRTFSSPPSPASVNGGGIFNESDHYQGGQGLRRANTQNNRTSSAFAQPRNNGYDIFGGSVTSADVMSSVSSYQPMGMFQNPMAYQPRPIGTPLSPTAAEFTTGHISANPWNVAVKSHTLLSCLNFSNYLLATFFPRSNLRLTHGASQLSPSPGPERDMQLEVHR